MLAVGQYEAAVKGVSPYYRKPKDSGGEPRLSVAVKCLVGDGDGSEEIVSNQHIELNDGSLSERTLSNLRKVFPLWDGTIEGLFIEQNFMDVPCKIEIEHKAGIKDPSQIFANVKWLNPPGGGGGGMPEPADPKDLLAKYGGKFRALAGGKLVAAPAAKAPAPTAKAPAAPAPKAPAPAAKAPPAPKAKAKTVAAATPTMEQCWAEVCKNHPDGNDATAYWEKVLAKFAEGKNYVDITAEEWTAIAKECEDNLPF